MLVAIRSILSSPSKMGDAAPLWRMIIYVIKPLLLLPFTDYWVGFDFLLYFCLVCISGLLSSWAEAHGCSLRLDYPSCSDFYFCQVLSGRQRRDWWEGKRLLSDWFSSNPELALAGKSNPVLINTALNATASHIIQYWAWAIHRDIY